VRVLTELPEYIITSIISSISIVVGAVIGGVFSWIVTKKSTDKTIEVQNKIVEDNRKYSEKVRTRKNQEYANIIRLDICTALFNSIRILKAINENKKIDIYPIPMDKYYSSGIAYLKSEFELKEMSYIYQLYGVIEKLNRDTSDVNYTNESSISMIKKDFDMLLRKVYGENSENILKVDIENVSYEQLYDNKLIKTGYREVLKKLDEICFS
jgi:hypothetical protein